MVRIRVPALRDRPEDIPALTHHFWGEAAARVGTRATLSREVFDRLAGYRWPGNVRELQNVITALAVTAPPAGSVPVSALPDRLRQAEAAPEALDAARAQFERRFIQETLARAAGNRSRAATALGLSRQGLRKKMARLGLERSGDAHPHGGSVWPQTLFIRV